MSQQTLLLKIMVLTKTCQHSSFTQLELKGVELVEKIFCHDVMSLS